MKTLYIDVYFLLNFTVDLLSIYFASKIIKVKIKNINLLLISVIGASYSVIEVLLSKRLIIDLVLFVFATFLVFVSMGRRISFFRKLKVYVCFMVMMALIGGAVYFFYSLLSRYFEYQPTSEPQNRKLLVMSVIIIVSFSIIKLVSTIISKTKSEKNVSVAIKFKQRRIECDALVDTGNLLVDPIDSTPVMLITQSLADRIIPEGIPQDIHSISEGLKRYVRIIPIRRGKENKIYIGFLPDYVEVKAKKKWESIKLIFVVDKDAIDFGGYNALAPASVLEI